ncbi:MAG: hypothetical protein B1H09_01225 [Gemmatimonadaceae bacterium 4484_173]|nr:MAG: hypothetical protein B1H09_01225 [Gemmatimonadaceae bacterium 4484_173]RKZ03658.1 MAG: hypothetical protein DRQ21_05190 [Candidatus Fermentibacteria bacterium]
MLVVSAISFAADRVVLFGDFSTTTCGPCASAYPQVSAFVDGYVANDEMAPFTWFLDGPASTGFSSHLWGYWTTGYVPTFVADGVFVSAGWNQTVWTNHVDNRLAVPAYLTIDADMVGDATGGTVTYTITAEQDLGSTLKLYSAIVQSGQVAGSAYGTFNGLTLHHIPVVMPCGNTGTAIEFTGPYPQTIQVVKPYTLDPSQHIFDELELASFVLDTSLKESMNAAFMDVPDTNTGISSGDEVYSGVLTTWPNPTTGNFSISSSVPQGTTGTVEIFDIAGRSIDQFNAGTVQNMTIEKTGIYFIRLTTSTGEVVRRQVAVIR